jgi:phosphoglycerate dehydrogenase-like enzyme
MSVRPQVTLAMGGTELRDSMFSDRLRRRLHQVAQCDFGSVVTDFANSPRDLSTTEVLLTGWGCPRIDGAALTRLPRLRLIAHAAGTVKGHVDPICWERGITVTSAAVANAVPVAEYTLAQILLAGKAHLVATSDYAGYRPRLARGELAPIGNYDRTVGIISASTIGRLVMERLKSYDLDVVVYDPTITAQQAEELGAELVDLDELMRVSDVVSLHAPVLPSTIGMVGAVQLARMENGATFINTARGQLVDHQALRTELASGRIFAILDVTDPEPLAVDDPLFALPNVQITPHIAGSLGTELFRMTDLAVDEIERLAAGEPPQHPVRLGDLAQMA